MIHNEKLYSKKSTTPHGGISRVRILIVEDDEDDFLIVSEYIKKIPGDKFIIDWCPKYKTALEKMRQEEYDIYFVDYFLGPETGLQLLTEAISFNCEQPIILLTGQGNHAIDIKAMEAGAYDYLTKSELNTEKLERCIRYSLERASYARSLRESERKFRGIFEKSKDAVFITDQDLFFKDVNMATSELLQYPRQELLEISLFSLLHDEKVREIIEEQLKVKGEINDLDIDILTKRGAIRNCLLSFTTETDKQGNIYMQGIIHDITNLKRAEKANLQIQKLAVTSRLVRTLAHEIRNPLNNINLSAEQLEAGNSEEPKIYLDIISRNANRIDDILTELLSSSKTGEMNIREESLQTIMDESIASALDRLTLKRIHLNVSYANNHLKVLADPKKLKIGFLNIIINAIEAMEADKGKLTISIRNIGLEHVVMIEDNGCGISPENLTRLFEPYFTTKRNGLGLGLASALSTFQSHHAYIDVQSKLNEGTTFLITFKSA